MKIGYLLVIISPFIHLISYGQRGEDYLQFTDDGARCDALYMAPPAYAQLASITGDKKYMKFMHKEFMVTYDFLYNREDSLFFRDHHYFNVHEKNGEHVYWGRGNGWVMGGLVAILKELPEKSRYREFYE